MHASTKNMLVEKSSSTSKVIRRNSTAEVEIRKKYFNLLLFPKVSFRTSHLREFKDNTIDEGIQFFNNPPQDSSLGSFEGDRVSDDSSIHDVLSPSSSGHAGQTTTGMLTDAVHIF